MASNTSQITQLNSQLSSLQIQEAHSNTHAMSTKDSANRTLPLFVAIAHNSKAEIEDLLAKGASLFESNKDNLAAYHAIRQLIGTTYALALLNDFPPLEDGFRHVKNLLLCADNDPAEVILSSHLTCATSWWQDPLKLTYLFFLACKNSATSILCELIDHVDIHCHSELIEYRSLLMWTARFEHTYMVKKLIERGSSYTTQDLEGIAAWEYISKYCGKEFLTLLLQEFPLQPETTCDLICQLIEKGENDLALLVIDRLDQEKPDFWSNRTNRNPIFLAAAKKNFKVAAEKIAHHLDVYLQEDHSKKTVLMYALEHTWEKSALLCIRQGASLLSQDSSGKKAFDYIVQYFGNERATLERFFNCIYLHASYVPSFIGFLIETEKTLFAKALLTRAAEASPLPPWRSDKKKLAAIFCTACQQKQKDLCNYLLEHIDVNYPTNDFSTPIMLAAQQEWNTIVLQLVERNASLTAKNQAGKYAWDYINEKFNTSFKEQLLRTVPLEAHTTALFIELLYNQKLIALAKMILGRVVEAAQKPSWWSDAIIVSRIFCWAAMTQDLETCSLLFDKIDIHFVDREGRNRTPLMYVAAKGWLPLTLKLIAKGARLIAQDAQQQSAWDYILNNKSFDTNAIQACMNAIPPTSSYAEKLIYQLIKNSQYEEASYLFLKSQKEQWSWLKNRRDCAELFCLMAQKENKPICISLLEKIDPNFVDTHNQTPTFYVCQAKWPQLLLALVQQGANLHTIHAHCLSTFSVIEKTFGNEFTQQVLQLMPTTFPALGHLLLELLKTKHAGAKTLLTRLLARAVQSWQTPSFMSKIFLAAIELYPQLAAAMIAYIDPSCIDVENQNKSALMLALENKLSETELTTLLRMGADLTHKNSQKISALEQLLTLQAVPITNTHLQCFLKQCGILEEPLRALSTHEALLKYLKSEIASSEALSIPAIIFETLFNEHEYVCKCLRSLSTEERIIIFREIGNRVGAELQLELIDLAFEIEPSHLAISLDCEIIPQKNSIRDIYKGLYFLYKTFFSSKTEENFACLKELASKVTNKTAYLGTPPDKSTALVDFYTQIDNAVCNTIQKFYNDISELEQHHHSPIQALLKTRNEDAIALAGIINNFLTELIDASKYCGGRIIAVVTQEYNRIVLKKSDDIRTMFLTDLTHLRQELISDYCSSFEQSAHAYNLFVKTYGQALNLPGWTALAQFADPFANEHLSHIEDVREDFLSTYKPRRITTYLQSMLENDPLHGKFITLLGTLTLRNWQKAATKEILKKVCALCKNHASITAAEKESIQKLLSQAPYFMTLSASDVSSIEAIEKSIASFDQLFIALSQEGKTFSLESILFALVAMKIIKT